MQLTNNLGAQIRNIEENTIIHTAIKEENSDSQFK